MENEVEREISKGLQCSRKLKYSVCGKGSFPALQKPDFLTLQLIYFQFYLVFLSIFTQLGVVWLGIALVGGLPGFVGLSNRVFRTPGDPKGKCINFQDMIIIISEKCESICINVSLQNVYLVA